MLRGQGVPLREEEGLVLSLANAVGERGLRLVGVSRMMGSVIPVSICGTGSDYVGGAYAQSVLMLPLSGFIVEEEQPGHALLGLAQQLQRPLLANPNTPW